MTQVKVFGREPALWITLLGAAAIELAGLGLPWFTAAQSTVVVAALAAVLMAATTRPVGPGVFISALAALAAVATQYGLHWADAQVAGLSGIIMAVFGLIGVRPQVTPAADPRPLP